MDREEAPKGLGKVASLRLEMEADIELAHCHSVVSWKNNQGAIKTQRTKCICKHYYIREGTKWGYHTGYSWVTSWLMWRAGRYNEKPLGQGSCVSTTKVAVRPWTDHFTSYNSRVLFSFVNQRVFICFSSSLSRPGVRLEILNLQTDPDWSADLIWRSI